MTGDTLSDDILFAFVPLHASVVQHISLSQNPMLTAQTKPSATFYQRIVGDSWSDLAEPVRQFHTMAKQFQGAGLFTVRHGRGFLARLFARIMRLPAEGEKVPVKLVVVATDDGEQWNRMFADRPFITKQGEHPAGYMTERVGLTEIWYRLLVVDEALHYEQAKASLRLGRLRIPLPRVLAPNISAREWAMPDGRGVNVSVNVKAPLVGLLINYTGYIVRED